MLGHLHLHVLLLVLKRRFLLIRLARIRVLLEGSV